jgi:hypothetical protein
MKPSILVLIAGAILFGCSRQEKQIESRPPQTERVEPGTQPQTAATQPATDSTSRVMGSAEGFVGTASQTLAESESRMTEAIRNVIAPMAGAANAAVEFHDGKATLRGTVDNEQEKTSIGDAARTVPGVSEVDNQIQVSGATPTPAPAAPPATTPGTE